MRIVLRDYTVVIGEASFNQTANHLKISTVDVCVVVVKLNGNHFAFLCQHGFQQVSRLLWKNKRCLFRRFYRQITQTNQLMSVGRNKSKIIRVDIEINTIHNRTQFIVGRGKNGTADTIQQCLCIYKDGHNVLSQWLLLRIGIPFLSDKVVFTILEMNENLQIVVVDIKRKRLFGKLFQRLQQNLCRDCKYSATLRIHYIDRGDQPCFGVGCCHC